MAGKKLEMSFTPELKRASGNDLCNSMPKRTRHSDGTKNYSRFYSAKRAHSSSKYKSPPDIWDYNDSSSVQKMVEGFGRGKHGSQSVTKDIEELVARNAKLLSHFSASISSKMSVIQNSSPSLEKGSIELVNQQGHSMCHDLMVLVDDCVMLEADPPKSSEPISKSHIVINLDSDDEDEGGGHLGSFEDLRLPVTQSSINLETEKGRSLSTPASILFDEIKLEQPVDDKKLDIEVGHCIVAFEGTKQSSFSYQKLDNGANQCIVVLGATKQSFASTSLIAEEQTFQGDKPVNKGVYVGVKDDLDEKKGSHDDDGLGDLWMSMDLALESSKEDAVKDPVVEQSEVEDCDHSYVLRDDLGYVCRVCGIISKGIDTIFEFQWGKGPKSTRTYMKDRDQVKVGSLSLPYGAEQDLSISEISVHPRHMKQMRPHQLQGFNFLVKNLVSDTPNGCVLAHAPGSGKTFMVFSFLQSYLAKDPNGRPLVILPKSILGSWKKEINKWQIEDIPLYDFYSSKASRMQQLDILNTWVRTKGILFLGYQQFSSIVCGSLNRDSLVEACHEILIKVPTILILDEGHNPRNDETDMATSLARVQTPRKVVLSGTIFQNHVKEVFNILNLVRPTFGKSEAVRAIAKRIISRVHIRVGKRPPKAELDATFFELVEESLRKVEDLRQKLPVIQDLREMTSEILHYYKGDFLDELPGLVDLSVLLNLSVKQKPFVKSLEKMEKFKSSSIGSALYTHPELRNIATISDKGDKKGKVDLEKIEDLIEKINYNDGVKTKFFLNMVRFCESSGEKLLIFSQYLSPLKFLEKLLIRAKGWSVGKHIFLISGETTFEQREYAMDGFNNTPDAKVFFGSIKACGEGISLVGASRVLIWDVHLNPSVTRQAIARAFRPGQVKKVYVYRLVAADAPEEEDENTSFRKELIAKMWFEWSMYSFPRNLEMQPVDMEDLDDPFWEFSTLKEDVKVLYQR